VRADPVSQQGDIDIAKGPLLDEYELEPIARVGYHVEWFSISARLSERLL